MSKDDFYIGWQDKELPSYRKAFLRFFVATLVILLLFVGFFTKWERGFIDSYFEYGQLTELKGVLVTEPVAGLVTEVDGVRKTVPLVGFGKFGALPVLENFQSRIEGDISSYSVVVRGTQFSYQDKLWMELTEGDASIVSFERTSPIVRETATIGMMDFAGEIVDPKCFFGVMNPSTKAVHRSCAIRCISGGVPPVLGIRRDGEFVDYYFLTDTDLRPLNQEVLPYVGLPVALSGSVVVYDDWKFLKVSSETLSVAALGKGTGAVALCFD